MGWCLFCRVRRCDVTSAGHRSKEASDWRMMRWSFCRRNHVGQEGCIQRDNTGPGFELSRLLQRPARYCVLTRLVRRIPNAFCRKCYIISRFCNNRRRPRWARNPTLYCPIRIQSNPHPKPAWSLALATRWHWNQQKIQLLNMTDVSQNMHLSHP